MEDEAVIAMDESARLRARGFQVIVAATGETALERIRGKNCIDLVLMDIDLGPGMDGTEAARLILEARSLPVVFLSSHTSPEIVERTEKITSFGYVVKQAGETVLVASIKMAFRLYAAQERIRLQNEALRRTNKEMQLMLSNMITAFRRLGAGLRRRREVREFQIRLFQRGLLENRGFSAGGGPGEGMSSRCGRRRNGVGSKFTGKIAVTGKPKTFEMFHGSTGAWYRCNAYISDEISRKIGVIFIKISKKEGNPEI